MAREHEQWSYVMIPENHTHVSCNICVIDKLFYENVQVENIQHEIQLVRLDTSYVISI